MAGAAVSNSSPILFGRDAESARIDRVLARPAGGAAGLVVISGEAGIGKTRFIEEALQRSRGAFRVLRSECLALGSGIPYLPFAALMRDLAHQLPAHRLTHLLGSTRSELARVLPELAETPAADGAAAVSSRGDELARLRLYEAFLRLAERIAADEPTVFVIEDVQWIDPASLELLSFLAHGVRQNEQATLIVSVRPEEVEDKEHILTLLAELGRSGDSERIELGPLSADATLRMATTILGEPPAAELIDHIQARSDGNPLFTEELLAAWRRDSTQSRLPPKLRDLLAARLAQVPDEVLEVLRVAAAAGRWVDDRLLTKVSGLPAAQVQRSVRTAVDDVILVRGEGADHLGYRFRHEILRSLVAGQLLPAETRRIHAAYATALAEEPPERRNPSELADHWDAAGDARRALVAHVEAGRAAVSALAFEQAWRHFGRALELWPEVDDASALAAVSRATLTDAAASAAARAGAFEHAVELSRRLIGERDTLTDDDWQLARSSLRWYLWEAGQLELALSEAESVMAEPDVPARWRANALGHAAGLLLYLGQTDEAATRAAEARDLAQRADAREEHILAQGLLGWCRLLAGDVEAGLADLRHTLEEARAVEGGPLKGRYPVGTALAHAQLATALELTGRLEEAHDVAVAGADIAARQGVARTLGSTLQASAARALYQLGRWEAAVKVAAPALDAGAVGGGRVSLLACLALIDVARGRSAEAAATMAMAESSVNERTPLDVRRWLNVASVEHMLWSGDHSAALALLALAADDTDGADVTAPGTQPAVLDASVPYLLALGARACADAARAERASGEDSGLTVLARPRLEDALDRAAERQALSGMWAAYLALAQAELSRADDAPAEHRVKAWREAHAVLAAHPYAQAYAGWRLAEACLALREGREQAAQALQASWVTAATLGARPLETEISGLATRARITLGDDVAEGAPASADGSRAFGLTQREAEVLVLLAQGLANQEIAERLYISPKTASVHVSNIYGKLGVESRVAAATLAHEMGLDRAPEETE